MDFVREKLADNSASRNLEQTSATEQTSVTSSLYGKFKCTTSTVRDSKPKKGKGKNGKTGKRKQGSSYKWVWDASGNWFKQYDGPHYQAEVPRGHVVEEDADVEDKRPQFHFDGCHDTEGNETEFPMKWHKVFELYMNMIVHGSDRFLVVIRDHVLFCCMCC